MLCERFPSIAAAVVGCKPYEKLKENSNRGGYYFSLPLKDIVLVRRDTGPDQPAPAIKASKSIGLGAGCKAGWQL